MLTGNDIGKRIIIFDPNKNKWEPAPDWYMAAIDSSIGYAYIERKDRHFKWPCRYIRVLECQ